MFLIDVIPLTKISLAGPQVLSYFSSQKIKQGALVSIPLGKRKIKAIVYNSFNISENKLEIKKSEFSLKPIDAILCPQPIITSSQLELALWVSNKYLSPLGLTIKLFLPKAVLKRKKSFDKLLPSQAITVVKKNKKSLPSAQNSFAIARLMPILFWKHKRSAFYLTEIKKALKQKKTVLFLVPETSKIEAYLNDFKTLNHDITSYSGQLKTSQELKIWQDVWQGRIKFIIGTRSSVFLPFPNLGLIIVDEEESPHHRSWDQHPRYNAKDIALRLAETCGAKIILGTALPTVESFYATKKKKYKLEKGIVKTGKLVEIVDMRNEIRWGNFSIFSEKLQKELEEYIKEKKQILLFINRKGLATTIFCKRCGHLIKCKHCDAPMVYHRKSQKPKAPAPEQVRRWAGKIQNGVLVCHHCGRQKPLVSVCPNCGSTKMKYAGIGTQKVMEKFKKLAGFISPGRELKIEQLDSDTPENKQKSIIEAFKNKKLDVLVATQIVFKYPGIHPDLTAVVLFDNVLNLPDYRSAEKTFQILFKLKLLSKKTIVQTYKKEFATFNYLRDDDFQEYFNEELGQRKTFLYPPFSEIIKLSYSHQSKDVGIKNVWRLAEDIRKIFPEKQILGPAPALISRIKNRYFWNIIIKSRTKDKPRIEGIKNLLSSNWTIDVNPENLL